jgi:hypothetical protein
MGQAELNSVLSALADAHARQRENAQQVALDAFRKQQGDEANERIKNEKDRLNMEHAQHQQVLDTTKQLRRLQLHQDLEKAQSDVYKTGTLPLGSSFTNGNLDQGGTLQLPDMFNDDNGAPATLNIEPIKQHAQRIADLQKIIDQPKVDEATRKEAQLATDRLVQQKAIQEEINSRATEANQNRQLLAQMHNDTLKAVTSMRATPGATEGIDNNAIAQDVADLLGAKTTKEEINKKYTGKLAPLKVAVLNAAAKQGVPVGKADKDQLDALKKHVENMDTLDNTLDAMPNTEGYLSSVVHAPGLMANQSFNSNIKQLNSNLPAVAIAKSGTKRINNLDMQLVGGGYIPKVTTPKTEAIMNRDKTVAALNKMVEDIVPNASPAQKALFKQYVGLDQIQGTYNTRQTLKDSQSKIDALLPPVPQQGAPVQ